MKKPRKSSTSRKPKSPKSKGKSPKRSTGASNTTRLSAAEANRRATEALKRLREKQAEDIGIEFDDGIVHEQREGHDYTKWRQRGGQEISIFLMLPPHLAATYRMIKRGHLGGKVYCADGSLVTRWMDTFENELRRRGYHQTTDDYFVGGAI